MVTRKNVHTFICKDQKSERVRTNPQEVVFSEQCSGSEDLVMGRSLLADSFTLATRKTVHIFNHRASEKKVLMVWQILLTYSSNGDMNHVMILQVLDGKLLPKKLCTTQLYPSLVHSFFTHY